jgi:uncharacterized caspase-like protein
LALALAFNLRAAAHAEERLALVVGIDAYREVPRLEKAVGDAHAVAATLQGLGFTVTEVDDPDRRSLNQAISTFGATISVGDTVFVHFSGHGVEIDGENYLLAADAPKPTSGREDFIKSEAVPMSALVSRMADAGAAVRVFVIDACRDNPFEKIGVRSVGATRGLARVEAPAGTFIMYSAGYRQTALDALGPDDHEPTSVYTRVLLKYLGQPNVALDDVAQDVRSEVEGLARGVGHDQRPAYYDELSARVVLVPGVASPEPAAAAPGEASAQMSDTIAADYTLANEIGTAAAWDAFLAKHGSDAANFYVQLAVAARDKVAAVTPQQDATITQYPAASSVEGSAPEIPPTEAEELLALSLEQRQAVQRSLEGIGYDPGVADGQFGERTRDAITRYQAALGVPTTGYVTARVLSSLESSAVHDLATRSMNEASRYDPSKIPAGADPRLKKAIGALKNNSLIYGYFDGHLYLAVLAFASNWEGAKQTAEAAGGHLITIGSKAENDFAYELFGSDKRFLSVTDGKFFAGPWIGLYQDPDGREPEGGWRWVTGEPVSFAGWLQGKPDNLRGNDDFAFFFGTTTTSAREREPRWWHDAASAIRLPGFIMEVD